MTFFDIQSFLVRSLYPDEEFYRGYGISMRERQILGMVIQGIDNRTIARYLARSIPTVKSHIKHIYEKLEVQNRDELFDLLRKHHESSRGDGFTLDRILREIDPESSRG